MRRSVHQLLRPKAADTKQAAPRVEMFHGSSVKNLQSILSQGLIPVVKKKNWDGDDNADTHTPSREAYGGIYVTDNFMTAASSPRDQQDTGAVVLCCLELQPNTFLLDEDDINSVLNLALQHVSDSAYWVLPVYLGIKFPDKVTKWNQANGEHYKNKYIEDAMARFEYEAQDKLGEPMHEDLKKRILSMLPGMWEAAVTRLAAQTSKDRPGEDNERDFKKAYSELFPDVAWDQIPPKKEFIPSVAEGEQIFREASEKITRAMRLLARPKKDAFRNTARIMEPIGYSGSNRITAVLEIRNSRKYRGEDFKTPCPILLHYGKIPEKFNEQWMERQGSEYNLIDARRGKEQGRAVTAADETQIPLLPHPIIDNPAFQAWFSGSKVVDKNGQPLRVYHGTRAGEDFDEFSVDGPVYNEDDDAMSSSGSGADPGAYMGAHFAQETSVANQFARADSSGWMRTRYDGEDTKPRVIPVYLCIRNPKVFSHEQDLQNFLMEGTVTDDYALGAAMTSEDIEPETDEADKWYERYQNERDFRREQNDWMLSHLQDDDGNTKVEIARELGSEGAARLQQAGHDGVKYQNMIEGGTSWIAFRPNQIKSAIGNSGKFDPNSHSITANTNTTGTSDEDEEGSDDNPWMSGLCAPFAYALYKYFGLEMWAVVEKAEDGAEDLVHAFGRRGATAVDANGKFPFKDVLKDTSGTGFPGEKTEFYTKRLTLPELDAMTVEDVEGELEAALAYIAAHPELFKGLRKRYPDSYSITASAAVSGKKKVKTTKGLEILISKELDHNIKGTVLYSAETLRGEFIGSVWFGDNSDNTWSALSASVNKSFQRQGVATALYDAAKKDKLKVVPAGLGNNGGKRSPDAYAFWEARKPKKVKLLIRNDLYHGTSTKVMQEIKAAGGEIKAPSYWGSKRVAKYYAEETAEADGSKPFVIRRDESKFDKEAFSPDLKSVEEPLTYTLGASEEELQEEWEYSKKTWRASLQVYESVVYNKPVKLAGYTSRTSSGPSITAAKDDGSLALIMGIIHEYLPILNAAIPAERKKTIFRIKHHGTLIGECESRDGIDQVMRDNHYASWDVVANNPAWKIEERKGLSELPIPEVKIPNTTGADWLGRDTYDPKKPDNTLVEIQKRITGHDRTLRRVVAHELCHHANNLITWAVMPSWDRRYRKDFGHGREWLALADLFNQRFGANFVTEKSDKDDVIDRTGKEFYLLLTDQFPKQGIFYQYSVNPSEKQIAYLQRCLGGYNKERYKLIRSSDHSLTAGAERVGVAWTGKKDEDGKAKLKDLWDNAPAVEIPEVKKRAGLEVTKTASMKGWMSPDGEVVWFHGQHAYSLPPEIWQEVENVMKVKFPNKKRNLKWEEKWGAVGIAQGLGYARIGKEGWYVYIHYDKDAPGGKEAALHALKYLKPRLGTEIIISTKPKDGWHDNKKFYSPGLAAHFIRTGELPEGPAKRATGTPGTKRYHYVTNCVSSDEQSIHDMVDGQKEVTYTELARNCANLKEFAESMGYGRQSGLYLSKDWSVSFHKSVFRGVPCYYIDHSGIEYIFTLDGELPERPGEPDEEEPEPKMARAAVGKRSLLLQPRSVTAASDEEERAAAMQHPDASSYMRSHNTGWLPGHAYSSDRMFTWQKKEDYPKLLRKAVLKDGREVELRQEDRRNSYSKKGPKDEDGFAEYLRDEKGNLVPYSEEEIKELGLPIFDTAIMAFDEEGNCCGQASNEWGADLVAVRPDYRGVGLGTILLTEFRRQYKNVRRMGQMTDAGEQLAKSYYRNLLDPQPEGKPRPYTPKMLKVYRGVSAYNKRNGAFYTTDPEWARNFTQSGQDQEIISATIRQDQIYMPKEDGPPYAGDIDLVKGFIRSAKDHHCKAIWCSEGVREPNSIYVFDQSALTQTGRYIRKPS